MMPNELWLNDIDTELLRADEARRIGHEGRLRTCARRIAGIALRQYSLMGRSDLAPADDVLAMLRQCSVSPVMPADIRAAADRLQTRVSADFTSPSTDPMGDAMLILSFVKSAY
jgi:hypothetical protein